MKIRALITAVLAVAGPPVASAQPAEPAPQPAEPAPEPAPAPPDADDGSVDDLFTDQGTQVSAGPAASANAFNPTLTVVGNGLYRYDDQPVLVDATRVDGQFNLREVELDLRAAIDPFADGVVIAALESEVPGEFEAAIEEGYVRIKRLPIPVLDDPPLGLKLTIGRFRTELGRNNIIHLHDLPQMTRPLVVEELLGEEGHLANGASARVFLPTPFDDESAVELTAQVLTGGGLAVADSPGHRPGYIGNLRWFRDFSDAHSVDLSLIFHFGRTGSGPDRNAFTTSADLLYKWKPLRQGEFQSFVLGGQLFHSKRQFEVEGMELEASPLGYYAWAQYQLTRTTYLGTRWDDTATIVDDSVRRRAIGGYFTWYTSEFLRLRVGYERRISDLADEDGRNSAFAEINFVFGAHPPEPFWVNR